jgi:hypothetical protein
MAVQLCDPVAKVPMQDIANKYDHMPNGRPGRRPVLQDRPIPADRRLCRAGQGPPAAQRGRQGGCRLRIASSFSHQERPVARSGGGLSLSGGWGGTRLGQLVRSAMPARSLATCQPLPALALQVRRCASGPAFSHPRIASGAKALSVGRPWSRLASMRQVHECQTKRRLRPVVVPTVVLGRTQRRP